MYNEVEVSVMNRIGNLNFGQQIVPIKSEKPITEEEKAQLTEVKKILDEKMGKDIISFNVKDPNSIDVVVNHPDPKVEKAIAQKLKEMASTSNPAKSGEKAAAPAPAPDAKAPAGKKLNLVG
jgi:hypothetical protein